METTISLCDTLLGTCELVLPDKVGGARAIPNPAIYNRTRVPVLLETDRPRADGTRSYT